ncbi:uncharacterized protein Dana_GF16464 [Drosophila ananassae]|uniref:Uncharacterized protein n=1 Tax=Drosophila ananassae TaxID=7217 RepID=B3M3A8_DROAN|nr:sperm-associated antigen 1 [Drosophila ananassae]EDV43569.1 uncharacterized protein Dana_GF16464 [Drosophila ananassae]
MEQKKSLLEKYDIPLNHLDFVYVEKCTNAREMEKIVHILRSGEEGYFPDLLRVSEEKLKELKPDSRLFRYEEPIKQSDVLDKKELKPIMDWTNAIKSKDQALNELKKDKLLLDMPSVRKLAKIDLEKSSTEQSKPTKKAQVPAAAQPSKPKEERIKATDYRKWDKYDPDEELLRMDLNEERNKEEEEAKMASQQKPISEDALLDEKKSMYERLQMHLKKLSPLEREQFAEKHRLRGNEFFRAKEYENAIEEYNCAILYDPDNAARSYNNRAVSHMKLNHYIAAISDCEACLQLEPENVKACLRLADANYAQGRRRESYYMYQRVLQLDPENTSAKKSLEKLNSQVGELAPSNATRLMIEELKPDADEKKAKSTSNEKPKIVTKEKPPADSKPSVAKVTPVSKSPEPKEYDLAELVKPNRVVKSKLVTAAEALGNKMQAPKTGLSKQSAPNIQPKPMKDPSPPMLRLPQENLNNSNKLLIQEI